MEGVAGIWRRHDPFVVRLVQSLVYQRVMQASVDQVDPEVGEDQEAGELAQIIPGARAVGSGVVEFRVAAHLSHEERSGEDGHDGKGD